METGCGVWSGSSWLRIGTGGGLLWIRRWTCGFWCHEVSFSLFICGLFKDAISCPDHKPIARMTGWSVKAVPLLPCSDQGGEEYNSYSFTTSALGGGEWWASRTGRTLPPGNVPGTHCTGAWVGPRAGLDTESRGKILSPLPGIEPRSSSL
jgi:hypothetical protein